MSPRMQPMAQPVPAVQLTGWLVEGSSTAVDRPPTSSSENVVHSARLLGLAKSNSCFSESSIGFFTAPCQATKLHVRQRDTTPTGASPSVHALPFPTSRAAPRSRYFCALRSSRPKLMASHWVSSKISMHAQE